MSNDFRNLERDLRAFAKRNRNVTYTKGLLMTFLITGTISLSTWGAVDTTQAARQGVNVAITDMRQTFSRAREENKALLKDANLELIQLMEQGDHVVKSPWSSWQFGVNTFINNHKGSYKGKGDKVKDVKYEREQGFDKYQYQGSAGLRSEYGNTTKLGGVREPNAALPVFASLTPLTPQLKDANLSMNVNLGTLPAFEPATVKEPIPPIAPGTPTIGTFNFNLEGQSGGNGESHTAFNKSLSNGAIEAVVSGGGTFKMTRNADSTINYDYKDYAGTSPWGGLSGSITTTPWTGQNDNGVTSSNRGIQKVVGGFQATNTNNILANTNNFGNIVREFVHMDHHGHVTTTSLIAGLTSGTAHTTFDTTVSAGSNQTAVLGATNDVINNINATASQIAKHSAGTTAGSQIFGFLNSGRIVMEGINNVVTNNYDHNGNKATKSVHMNTGDIIMQPILSGGNYYDSTSAVFSLSNGGNIDGHHAIIYNGSTGNVDLWTKRSAYFLDSDTRRAVSLVNRGNVNLYGEGNVGTAFNSGSDGSALDLQFVSEGSTFNAGTNSLTGSYKPIVIYGDSSVGYYQSQANIIAEGNFAVNIGSDGVGNKNFSTNKTSAVTGGVETTGSQIVDYDVNSSDTSTTNKDYIRNSFGILSNSAMNLTSHDINIYDKTENNVGVMPNTNVLLNIGGGNITLNGGTTAKENIGVYIGAQGGAVKSTGDITLNGGKGNVGIMALSGTKPTGVLNNVEVRNLNVETDANNNKAYNTIAIYGKGGSKIEVKELNMEAYVETDASTVNRKNTGAVFADGSGTEVTISRTGTPTTPNIFITGEHLTDLADTSVGFGLFADNKAKITAENNNIKVVEGSSAIVAQNGSNIILNGSTVHYTADTDNPSNPSHNNRGYALFADTNGSTIEFKNGVLELGKNATGFSVDASSTTPAVDLTGTTIDVQSNDVTLMNLSNATGANTLNTAGLASQLLGFAGSPMMSAGSLAYTYKYAAIDGSKINVNSNIDKANTTTGSDSEVFTRRILLQNSIIDVNAGQTVKAELNTADLAGIDPNLTAPVGLAISASQNSKAGTTTTGIDNNGTVIADRTDAGQAGIGLYVNYGYVNNNSTGIVNVEKSGVNAPNDNAIGIYGTNSTVVNNDGQVNVGGQKSIGILGLSYRLNPTTGAVVDPSTEPYYANNPGTYGIVDIKNNVSGTIIMDDDSAIGMFVKNNSTGVANAADRRNETQTNATNAGTITINGSNNSIGMGSDNGTLTNDTTGTINVNGTVSAGMYGTNTSKLVNKGTINIANSTVKNESIGIFTDDKNTTIETSGTINTGTSNYGIYGKNVSMTGGAINVGDNGVGVYSTGPNVNLSAGTISVGNNNAVGVYIADDATTPAPTTVTGNVSMTVGDNDSFGYMITSTKAPVNLTTGAGTTTTVGERSVYIYSGAPAGLGGTITNNTNISTTKNNGYGIYSSQNVVNNGNINLTSGVGNIGIYSTEGHARNTGTIDVGSTNLTNEEYGIGMATGYYDRATGSISNQGTIENTGVINVTQDNSIGMYAAGAGSQAINRGTINLSGDKTTGMYIDQNATGINYGTIQTVASGSKIKGVVVVNGGIIKNYGTINVATPDGIGIYKDATGVSSVDGQDTDPATGVTGVNTSSKQVYLASATDEKIEGTVHIKVPPKANPTTVTVNGVSVPIVGLDTNAPTATATDVIVTDPTGTTTLNLAAAGFANTPNTSNATSLGMYVDTSGINYTNPINGLSNLVGLTDIDLVFGTEATKYTNAKAIQLGNNILNPYNNALSTVVSTGTVLNVNSSSLTWLAQPIQSTTTGLLDTVYLVKVPYTDFVSSDDSNTYNFLDGLEQRYDANDLSSREKLLFNKLNDLGKGEAHIFAQAVNEMKGYQYSNVQQRINQTGNLLDKEFEYLYDQWETKSKQSNKLKVFGMRDEYTTNTAGIIDTTSNAYGVAYLHEDETVKLGDTTGWYAGIVNNRFKFKDLGGSRENQTMLKLGIFKSTAFDDNNSLNWTIAGDIFGGIHDMKRRYWIVDDVFSADSNYYSYGVGLKNEISKTFRTGEKTFIRPYANLELEYGRMSDIKEKTGEMRLEVKGNDYFSVQPEVGVEFKYKNKFGKRSTFITSLGLAYENELGRVGKVDNKARVGYTNAGWYNLVNERDNRSGNFKADLNLGIENTRVGFTANLGYDTVGKNIRGGLGIRAIY